MSAGRDAESIFNFVEREMAMYDYRRKPVGQTYDGAAVMASSLSGLQAKVKAVAPQVQFVHCYAHRLNLVLSQGAKCISKARIFFANLSGFSTFLRSAHVLWRALEMKSGLFHQKF